MSGVYTGDFASKADIPTAATATPPAVADTGAQGSSAMVYARADHTHVQTEGEPTNTGVKMRVTKSNRSAVALIGLTVLSVTATPGATEVDVFALEP